MKKVICLIILLSVLIISSVSYAGDLPFINSKQDFYYVIANYPRTTYLPFLQSLYDDSFSFVSTGKVTSGSGITDSTHRVITDEFEKLIQQELVEDSHSRLILLGLKREEIKKILDNK